MRILATLLMLIVSLCAIPALAQEKGGGEPVPWLLAKGKFDEAPTAPQVTKFLSLLPENSRFLAVTLEHEIWVLAKVDAPKLMQTLESLANTRWTYVGVVEGIACAQSSVTTNHVELATLSEKLKIADNANGIVTATAHGLFVAGRADFIRDLGKVPAKEKASQ